MESLNIYEFDKQKIKTMNKKNNPLLILLSLFSFHYSFAQTGITWNMSSDIATASSGNEHPRIVTDGAGNPLVLWGHSDRAMFSRWNGTSFTTPVILNPMTMTIAEASWMGPDIAANGNNVYVVFKQTPEADTSSHIYIVHSADGGINFSAPVKVDNIGDSIARFPTVSVDATGNPIVGFMKFNSTFGDARWVVTKSTDFGNTFSGDVKASGYSATTAEVCDCCPGSITSSGNNVAMLYRDNNSNIRDTWCGISTNGGNSFPSGMALDENNWMLMSCPSSGPDGVIIGDTLYNTYMNGANGTLVYFSKASLTTMTNPTVTSVTGTITGLTQQNFPRIANSGNAVALVWKQVVNGASQLMIRFTDSISNGLPVAYDTVDLANITNADVTLANGKIFVVWEDDASGTVKYRSGIYAIPNSIPTINSSGAFSLYPNPVSETLFLNQVSIGVCSISILNATGQLVKTIDPKCSSIDVNNLPDGIYYLQSFAGYSIPALQKFVVHH